MATVVVAGAIANKPWSGGEAWVRLSWALGLQRLGFAVVLLEQLPDAAWNDATAQRRYFHDVVGAFGLSGHAALIRGDGPHTEGLAWEEVTAHADEAALLVNISGHLEAPALTARFGRRAFVDIDPGYTQIWHASGAKRVAEHETYFTIAENMGAAGCGLPTGGLPWLTCRQPVVLDEWPTSPLPGERRFTTIATWRAPFGRLEHAGRTYGMKLDEFRRLAALPTLVEARFELALEIHPDERPDLQLLAANGWAVVDATECVRDPDAFRAYVSGSSAELSPAQGVYVETRSGWFSDRSARYLAAGRPVLVQDTGFGEHLPVGEGLIAFTSLDDAASGARAIAGDLGRHGRAARAIAEEHFDSDKVLRRFLEQALP